MSEQRAEYLELGVSVACPKCGTEYGEYIQTRNQVLLKAGNAIIRMFYGPCLNCGFELNFHSSGKNPERLITRAKRIRERGVK